MRVGIAGYGLAGRFFHAPLIKGCGFDVVGILTNNLGRREDARHDFPEASLLQSIEELVAEDLDLLVVATVNSLHAEQAIAGLEAGIPVVVDKPMGRTYYETQSIIDVSETTSTPVTTFFNRLWDSDSLTIKKALSEGILGNVFRVDSRFERFRPQLNSASWRENSSSVDGGGLLLDLQPHLVSTALDWFGPAQLIYASVRSIRGGSDDDVLLVLKHESGVDSYLSASAIIGAPGPRIRLSGDQGSLIVTELDPQEAMLKAGKIPEKGRWESGAEAEVFIHRDKDVFSYPAVPGNYARFYQLVEGAIHGLNPWPISTSRILEVAEIIDQARERSIR